MSTQSQSFIPLRTSFGMFVPCDRETYRKLKRIRHLATFAETERRRWDRSQRRLPHNRAFKRRRGPGRPERELVDATRMIFQPFYELVPAEGAVRIAQESDRMRCFFEDYCAARHPKPAAADVTPLKMSIEQIDALLTQIEVWNLKR
jgi:hypothetical protein